VVEPKFCSLVSRWKQNKPLLRSVFGNSIGWIDHGDDESHHDQKEPLQGCYKHDMELLSLV